jgi:hypothetical protein
VLVIFALSSDKSAICSRLPGYQAPGCAGAVFAFNISPSTGRRLAASALLRHVIAAGTPSARPSSRTIQDNDSFSGVGAARKAASSSAHAVPPDGRVQRCDTACALAIRFAMR